jgi:amino acid transporter
LDDLAENPVIKVSLGIVFIAIMTYISYRGIVISERIQAVFVSFQFVVLIVMNIIALVQVYGGSVGAQAVHPEWSWFSPFGLSASEIAAGVILCIFIYWGWDSCLAVTEETKDADKTPGRAALISTVILLFTYLIVAVAIQAFAGFGDTGIGLASAIDMVDPDDGFTTFGPIGGVFVIGVHAGTWRAADDCLRSTVAGVLPRRDARWGNPDLGARHRRAAGSAQRVAHAAPNQTQLRAERPIRHGNRRPRC